MIAVQNDWITLSTLGTFSGAVFVVTLISQFLKETIDRIAKFPTRIIVLVLSWLVLLGRQYVMTGGLTVEGAFLDLLNGFLVALSAMGAHAFAKDNFQWK